MRRSAMISIVNCGIGNIGSIVNMLKHIGASPRFASTPSEIKNAGALLLPGVGAFDVAMGALREGGFIEPLRRRVSEDKVPILGICLGMQLLGHRSEEGEAEGLGLIDAEFVKFSFAQPSSLKVPHMGWNTLNIVRDNPLIEAGAGEQRFYFVHSYHARCAHEDDVIATSDYGGPFVAAYGRDHIYGVQFHPEKSHRFGMRLLRNFVRFAC